MRVLVDCDVPAFIRSGMGIATRGMLEELFRDRDLEFHCVFSNDAPRRGWIESLARFDNVAVHFARRTKRTRNIRQLFGRPECLSAIAGIRPDVSMLLSPALPHPSDARHICIV